MIQLVSGVGNGKTTACVVSYAALLAGQAFNDAPPCVCPVIRNLSIRLNDSTWWASDEERTRKLTPLAARIIGSASTPEVVQKRIRLCVLTAARVFAASAMDSVNLPKHAAKLRTIADDATFEEIQIPNQGKGAAKMRVEAPLRQIPSIRINATKTEAGREALGAYHEKKDEKRLIGLGPNHDWASHGADAFGLACVAYEEPQAAMRERSRPRAAGYVV